MSDLLGQRAVVVGAGIGGLAIAGTLAKYFECVEIFERDYLNALPAWRSGPQDRHPHGLLADGAVGARVALICNTSGRSFAYCQNGISAYRCSASRPLIELVLRRRAEGDRKAAA